MRWLLLLLLILGGTLIVLIAEHRKRRNIEAASKRVEAEAQKALHELAHSWILVFFVPS